MNCTRAHRARFSLTPQSPMRPFTPIIETLRGLLNGSPSAGDAVAAVAWSLGIALVGYLWALSTFERRT